MSRKVNKSNQQSSSKEGIVDLAALAVARRVTVLLPESLDLPKINEPLMHSYLRTKISGKKVYQGQEFVALYLGKEHNFTILEINSDKEDNAKANDKHETSFIVSGETSIILKAVQEEGPQVKQVIESEFYGFNSELEDLKTTILHTLFHRKELIQNGLGPLKGILLSGFSGAGKSAILNEAKRAVCGQHRDIYWKSISSVEMLSRVVGGAEELIRNIFKQLREKQPAVLTIEDIHLLFGAKEVSSHETVLAALLGQLDKIVWDSVVVVATYNTDRDLSKSIRSSGKFEKEIAISLPNHSTRLDILQGMFKRLGLLSGYEIEGIKRINLRLNGFSVGEIKQILR